MNSVEAVVELIPESILRLEEEKTTTSKINKHVSLNSVRCSKTGWHPAKFWFSGSEVFDVVEPNVQGTRI